MQTPIKLITPESFVPFGDIIQHDGLAFASVLEQPDAKGWQLAANNVVMREHNVIHRHPDTREFFCPLSGAAVLIVAEADTPEQWQAFLLDKPVCIFANTWHVILTLSDRAVIQIAENLQVSGEEYELSEPIRLCAVN